MPNISLNREGRTFLNGRRHPLHPRLFSTHAPCSCWLLQNAPQLTRRLSRPIESRDEVGQALSLDQNMLPEEPFRPIAVPGTDSIHDALVLCQ